jgi:hypothetical protein
MIEGEFLTRAPLPDDVAGCSTSAGATPSSRPPQSSSPILQSRAAAPVHYPIILQMSIRV